jgi:hypothetical protein
MWRSGIGTGAIIMPYGCAEGEEDIAWSLSAVGLSTESLWAAFDATGDKGSALGMAMIARRLTIRVLVVSSMASVVLMTSSVCE